MLRQRHRARRKACSLGLLSLEPRTLLTGYAPAEFRVLDDGDPGFMHHGAWNRNAWNGYQGDSMTIGAGAGHEFARWEFTDLPDGTYGVYATWRSTTVLSTEATYRVSGGFRPAMAIMTTVGTGV